MSKRTQAKPSARQPRPAISAATTRLHKELTKDIDWSRSESEWRQLVETATAQRDSALKELNDRANINIAIERLARHVTTMQEIGMRLIRLGKQLERARGLQ